MKTTNTEGGMRDAGETESIMQIAIEATKIFNCWRSRVSESSRMSEIDSNSEPKILPNLNQDMWLKYLVINLQQINDLDWVNYLLQIIEKLESQFNPGQFRGALFHLNF